MTTQTPLAVGSNWLALAHSLTPDNFEAVVREDAKRMRDAGFDALELPLPHVESWMHTWSASQWADVAGWIHDEHLRVASVHGPTLLPLDRPLEEAIERLIRYIEPCCALGAPVLVVHPTPHSHPHVCTITPELLNRDTAVATAVSEAIGDRPLTLAIENLPTYGLRYLHELMSRLDQPNIGVCFDTGHWSLRPEGELESAFVALEDRIAWLHLTDNHGLCDEHLPPGEGLFPWIRFFKILPDRLLAQPLLIELGAPVLFNDADAAAKSLAIHQAAGPIARTTVEACIVSRN